MGRRQWRHYVQFSLLRVAEVGALEIASGVHLWYDFTTPLNLQHLHDRIDEPVRLSMQFFGFVYPKLSPNFVQKSFFRP